MTVFFGLLKRLGWHRWHVTAVLRVHRFLIQGVHLSKAKAASPSVGNGCAWASQPRPPHILLHLAGCGVRNRDVRALSVVLLQGEEQYFNGLSL